jgi:GTP-binding protein
VDKLLVQNGIDNALDRVMDSNDLEKERGITILSKNTAITYKDKRINIVDTPGHADFGGEVERVLSMVDGVILVVCAQEGPMPQTQFVLSKALKLDLKPIVVMNKIDRDGAQPEKVENDLLELFIELDASEDQMNYPIIYASAKEGYSSLDPTVRKGDFAPLLDKIVELIPPPMVDVSKPFSMLVTQIENDPYVGKCYLGRIESGLLKLGDAIHNIDPDGNIVAAGKCTKITRQVGLQKQSLEEAVAGDIVSISGLSDAYVNHTICHLAVKERLQYVPVDEPTISMNFYVNDSPLAGKEGSLLTSQLIKNRLLKELETNVSLQLLERNDAFEIKGRGELQMGVLIETMRREGFELSVSPPKVIYKRNEQNQLLEPIERITIDSNHEYCGKIIEKLTSRKGEMKSYDDAGSMARLIFEIPTRGLLGYPAEFKNDTHGQGTLNHIFIGYQPFRGALEKTRKGSLISTASGDSTAYALASIEPRGKLFISPGQTVYPGMIIGEHSRENDLEVNPTKAKQMTNIRAAGKDDSIKLSPPIDLSLEQLISYIQGE